MPRAGLSADRVVAEAEQLADEGQPVTLAALASRLGVQAPSLYKHVAGVDALQKLVSLRARRELATVLALATVGRAGGDAVEALAWAYREWATAHPGRYLTTLRAPDPNDPADMDASRAAIQVVFDALGGYGLVGDDLIDATRIIRSALHGFVALRAAGAFELPDLDRSFRRLILSLQQNFDGWNAGTI